jgi:hypothetical protein
MSFSSIIDFNPNESMNSPNEDMTSHGTYSATSIVFKEDTDLKIPPIHKKTHPPDIPFSYDPTSIAYSPMSLTHAV